MKVHSVTSVPTWQQFVPFATKNTQYSHLQNRWQCSNDEPINGLDINCAAYESIKLLFRSYCPINQT